MIINLDNSAFSLLSCSRRFQLRVINGLADPKGPEAAFGDTVHHGLEYLDKGFSPDEMLAKLHEQSAKDIPKALTLITCYKLTNKLPPPIQNGVELKFRHRFGDFIIPNSHEHIEVYLCGTIDRVYVDNDMLVILDYKTTTAATPYMIDQKLAEYALSFQLPFYFYAIKNFGILPASYQDYIDTHKYRMEIQLMSYTTTPPTFKKHVRHAFNEDFINREVPLIINTKVSEAIEIAKLSVAAPHTGFTVYGACKHCAYRPACLVLGEAREDEILSRFEVTPYDPLTFR